VWSELEGRSTKLWSNCGVDSLTHAGASGSCLSVDLR